MTMRTVLAGLSVFGLAMCATVPAIAGGMFTGTLGATNDYVFRGISQSDSDPAVFGSLEYEHSGFMVGAWASTIDFSNTGDNGADVEIDLYAGYRYEFNDKTSLTGKVIYYWYPGADTSDANYWEFLASLNHDFGKFSGNLQAAFTPDYFGGNDSAFWLAGGVAVPLNGWLTASANVGYQWYDDSFSDDYAHGDVGVTVNYDMFALDLRYVMTDIDDTDCPAIDICDSRFVATLTLVKSSDDQ